MNNPPAIQLKNVSRSHGSTRVLKDINLTVQAGSICGLLGRNGSGKTTLLKMLAGLQRPDYGEVLINGLDTFQFSVEQKQDLGYVSEKLILPYNLRVSKLVNFCSCLRDKWDVKYVTELLNRFRIDTDKKVHALSLGGQRMLAFILAIAARPSVLLLDEPASNLDAFARREFLNQILQLARDNQSTVLFSTHSMADIERVSDQVSIASSGQITLSDSLDDLKDVIKQVRLFAFKYSMPETLPGCLSMQRDRHEIIAVMRLNTPQVLHDLESKYQCVTEIQDLPLEDIFLQISK